MNCTKHQDPVLFVAGFEHLGHNMTVLDFLNFTVRQTNLGFEKGFWLPLGASDYNSQAQSRPQERLSQGHRRSIW